MANYNAEVKEEIVDNPCELDVASREYVYDGKKAKDICLMDVATIAVKELKKKGMLKDLDESPSPLAPIGIKKKKIATT